MAAAAVIALIPIYTRSWRLGLPRPAPGRRTAAAGLRPGTRPVGRRMDHPRSKASDRRGNKHATSSSSAACSPRGPRTAASRWTCRDGSPGCTCLEASDGLGGRSGSSTTRSTTPTPPCPGHLPRPRPDRHGTQNTRVAGWAAFLRSQCNEDGAITRIASTSAACPTTGRPCAPGPTGTSRPDAPPAPCRPGRTDGGSRARPPRSARPTCPSPCRLRRARLAIKGAGGGQIGAAAVLVRESTPCTARCQQRRTPGRRMAHAPRRGPGHPHGVRPGGAARARRPQRRGGRPELGGRRDGRRPGTRGPRPRGDRLGPLPARRCMDRLLPGPRAGPSPRSTPPSSSHCCGPAANARR